MGFQGSTRFLVRPITLLTGRPARICRRDYLHWCTTLGRMLVPPRSVLKLGTCEADWYRCIGCFRPFVVFCFVYLFSCSTLDRNSAIFPLDDPQSPPLVGDATIVVVNDARHQLEANFLQRTVPYFFELTGGLPTVASGGRYRWAKVRSYHPS